MNEPAPTERSSHGSGRRPVEGDREQSGPPATKVTMYRGVVIIGCVLAKKPDVAGELFLRTGGSWTFDDTQPEVARALAKQLRLAADTLEKEAGS